jgi:hypothetical protein
VTTVAADTFLSPDVSPLALSPSAVRAPLVAALALGLAALGVDVRADEVPAASTPAASAPPALPPARPARRVIVEGQIGARAPLGQLGAAVTVDVVPLLSLSLGAGSSASSEFDQLLRLSFMPRYQLWSTRDGSNVASAGLGLAYGERVAASAVGLRLDAELSLEHRWAGGATLRGFAGFGRLVTNAGEPGGTLLPTNTPYVGVALGYAVWPNPVSPPTAPRWYGWQSLGLGLLGVAMLEPLTYQEYGYPSQFRQLGAWEAATVFLVSGPLVHYAHRRYGRAAGSLALRVLLPALGYSIGRGIGEGDEGGNRAGAGTVTGAVVAGLIDAFALGWEQPASSPR